MSRPPIYDDAHWAQVASVYREGYLRGTRPMQYVARRLKVTHSAAAKWVARCRDLGLLTRTTRGRARV